MRGALILLLTAFLFTVTVCGADSASQGEIYTPDEVRSLLGGDAIEFIKGGGELSDTVSHCLTEAASSAAPMFFGMLGTLVLSAVIRSLGEVWQDDGGVYGTVSRLCCCLLVAASVKNACFAVKTALDTMATFMTSMLGVMCVGWGNIGNITGGAKFASVTALAIQCVSFLSSYCVIPMTYSCFGLTLGAALWEKMNISSLISGIKNTACIFLTGSTVLFSFSLSLRAIGASGADTLVNRTVKFAAASVIPIIGSSLAEASGAVFESMKLIRTTSSLAALVVIFAIALPPLLMLCVDKLALGCASAAASLLSLDREQKLIDGINSLLTVLTAALICCFSLFVVCCGLFMKTRYA